MASKESSSGSCPFKLDLDHAFGLEEPVDTAIFTHVSGVAVKGVAHFGNGAVAILGHGLHQQSGTARP